MNDNYSLLCLLNDFLFIMHNPKMDNSHWFNAKNNLLEDAYLDELFNALHQYYELTNGISIIENDLQFGFVKNSMIPLSVPIIINWNFGKYTGMMNKVVSYQQINNLKLLPNNELSLSWNRELPEYFISSEPFKI